MVLRSEKLLPNLSPSSYISLKPSDSYAFLTCCLSAMSNVARSLRYPSLIRFRKTEKTNSEPCCFSSPAFLWLQSLGLFGLLVFPFWFLQRWVLWRRVRGAFTYIATISTTTTKVMVGRSKSSSRMFQKGAWQLRWVKVRNNRGSWCLWFTSITHFSCSFWRRQRKNTGSIKREP